jgi:hypothetical protein
MDEAKTKGWSLDIVAALSGKKDLTSWMGILRCLHVIPGL